MSMTTPPSMNTPAASSAAPVTQQQGRRPFWGWHLLFWAFFFIILGFNVPHGAEVFISVFGDIWYNWVIAYAFMIGVDIIIGYLTFARMQLSFEGKEKFKQGIYMTVIVVICAGSCYLQALYNAHNFQPHLLSGAQDVPGFSLLPYTLSILPLLNIVMASMASLVGHPAQKETGILKDSRTHEEKLLAIRQKAELRQAQIEAGLSYLPKRQKPQQQSLPLAQSQPAASLSLIVPPPQQPQPQMEQPLLALAREMEMETPAGEITAMLNPTPPQVQDDEEENTITAPQMPLAWHESITGYSTGNLENTILGFPCYSLSKAEDLWGIRKDVLRKLFDLKLPTSACWCAVAMGRDKAGAIRPNNRHVRIEAREEIVAYLTRTRPGSLVPKQAKKKGTGTGEKAQRSKQSASGVSTLRAVK